MPKAQNLQNWDGMNWDSMRENLNRRQWPLAVALCLAAAANPAFPQNPTRACARLELTGQVDAGKEWSAPIGEGWVFRVVPIESRRYSGWDLIVDRDRPAGYPDALLLATPPYDSINEREIATTFGLRAQDALGWNPRSFHFLVDPTAFREGQQLFAELNRAAQPANAKRSAAKNPAPSVEELTRALMALDAHAAAGQFRILDARLTPGTANAAPFAENWAIASERMQQSSEPSTSGQNTPAGEFHWMKFSVTLSLPVQWKAPKGVQVVKGNCG